MVIAHHIILTGYGHWLPNDIRGSLSHEVKSQPLAGVGEIHSGRKRIQPSRDELRRFQSRVWPLLQHEVRWFDPAKRQAIGDAFGEVIRAKRYTCYACAVLSNHAHLLVRKHRDRAEQMITSFIGLSKSKLVLNDGALEGHPIWSDDFYKKFVDSPEAVRRIVEYIESNPIRSKLPPQQWSFTTPYRSEWDPPTYGE